MMTGLCIGSFLVGICASFVLPVGLFILVLMAATAGRLVLAFGGSPSFGHSVLATIVCVALAQIGYVFGVVGQSFGGARSRDTSRSKLATSLRRLIPQRK